jgi:hypothetical protein
MTDTSFHPTISENEDEAVEAMVLSLSNPFPSECLMRAGDIDRWREIMRVAYRAAMQINTCPNTQVAGQTADVDNSAMKTKQYGERISK